MRLTTLLALLCFPAAALDDAKAPDFTLKDVSGKSHALSGLKDVKAVVLLFMGIECPRSVAAEPRLDDLAKKHAGKAAFLAIDSNWHESSKEIADHCARRDFRMTYLKDEGGKVAALYKVEIQPTAIVLDADLKVRYRGLIDDHKVEELVRNHYLRDALDALLAGKVIEKKSTEPVGCTIKKEDAKAKSDEVTFAKHVAPILNRSCVSCHRPGQVGPFSLETYEQAKAWSVEIKSYTETRQMPPWKPMTNHGVYYNERRLADEEIATLSKWHDNGAPMGDPKDLPPPPKFKDGWMLGVPDAVLKAEAGFELPAKGRDEYRCYVLQNPFDEDKWVTGVEYQPGNPRSVHHIIGYLDQSGQSERRDSADPAPGYRSNGSGPGILPSGSLAGWAPGNMPRMLPEGTARLLRKGERIVLETHYHKTGRAEKDEGAQVALYVAKTPVVKQVQVHMMANVLLRIAPGEANYKLGLTYTVPGDVHALDVMPHMHLIGKEMSVVATFPDGTKKDLVIIKDWDFGWQETYQFKEPMAFPKGTKIRMDARYDNSENNPNNPSHPPKLVRWGEQTTDEMCIAFIHYTVDAQDLRKEGKGK
ncbi:MAG TPA: redoxin domain-containing protein [Planctomycetota bacterium]|nr:redoxin domain-containing protein [Planctomycetota bacterium]